MQARNGRAAAVMLFLSLIAVSCAAPGTLPGASETTTAASPTVLLSPTPAATLSATMPAATTPAALSPAPAPSLAPLSSPAAATFTPSSGPVALDDLKYRLIAQFGVPFYCDPAQYPVAHPISDQQVAQYVAELQKNQPEYQAILRHLGLAGTTSLTAQQQRAVFYEYVMLNSITLTPAGGNYDFNLRVGNYGTPGTSISGMIDPGGAITVTRREPAFLSCPVCLSAGTLIDTPQGAFPVEDIRPGMTVWTVDENGMRRAAPVLQIIRRPVPVDFRIVHLTLQDGREIFVSPNHPTTDGRVIGELAVGDLLDGARVTQLARLPYTLGWTYDILPAGLTGTYRANGIWLKSTLLE